MQVSRTDAELSSLDGGKGSSSRGVIPECLHQLSAPHTLHPDTLRFVHESLEDDVVRFCVISQHDRAPATVADVIAFLSAQGATVERFSVRKNWQRQNGRLRLQTAKILEKDRRDVSRDDIKEYFETLSNQIRSIASAFIWNTDEASVSSRRKRLCSK
jgi:hypothetical protein